MMPGMDGFEVLREIRADPDLQPTPIVFVSVFSGARSSPANWSSASRSMPTSCASVLGAAVRAGRSRVLVSVARRCRGALEPALDELGIEHEWETSGAAAARACGERRFEVALVDVGIRNPQAVLQALDSPRPPAAPGGDHVLRRRRRPTRRGSGSSG